MTLKIEFMALLTPDAQEEVEEFIEGSKSKKEFEAFVKLLKQELDVYPGNDFRV